MKRVIYSELENYEDEYYQEDLYNDLVYQCNEFEGYFITRGYFGSWNGKQYGGMVSDSLIGALNCIRPNSDNLSEIYIENRELVVENYHHDGSSRVVVKQLTQKGLTWYKNNVGWKGRKELVEHLFNTKGYTKNIKLLECF